MPMLTFEGVFGGPVGTCRFNPPTDDCTWPIVLKSDWCREFIWEDGWGFDARVCKNCLYFSDAKILGQHPTVSA